MPQFKIHLIPEEVFFFRVRGTNTEEAEQTFGFEFSEDKTICISGQETVLKYKRSFPG